MALTQRFYERCLRARDYILSNPLFDMIYIGIFRSVNGIPDFYACNNAEWMDEYISKELWFIDPIVKEGLLGSRINKETQLIWGTPKISDINFLEYREAFVGHVKGGAKVFKHEFPDGVETIVIGIGLYPQNISSHEPLNVNTIFKEAETKIKEFIALD